MSKVYIIAEAGVNHNGSLDQALTMIDAAAEAGADAVKFQTFRAGALVTEAARKAQYQTGTTDPEESQYAMLKRLEFGKVDFIRLKQACGERGIDFLSTPFDLASIDLLADIGVDLWKIPSGELTDLPYLRKIGARNERVLLSTGMADINEVGTALAALEEAGNAVSQISVLHCTTEYPTPVAEVNLLAMQGMAAAFPGLAGVGYSDHTQGIEISGAAVALGARVIEKHFTLDRNLPGPDHQASLEPNELASMVAAIRRISIALGSSVKAPSASELSNREVVRKSIVASRKIRRGELFSEDNLTVKRPGNGISPMEWDQLIGLPASRDFALDQAIVR